MRTIGVLGGMSWESTAFYYQIMNEEVRRRLGGRHSARVLIYSVNFDEIAQLQHDGRWAEAGALLADAARRLEAAGADFLLLCTNTMHKVVGAIESVVAIPVVHIADPTAARIRAVGLTRVGLLGTRFTMEDDFCRSRLKAHHGIDVVLPSEQGRALVHRVIYEELCRGQVREDSRRAYVRIIEELGRRGAEGVILGCTEIGLLVRPSDSPLPVFDTARIHAEAAVDLALGSDATRNQEAGDAS